MKNPFIYILIVIFISATLVDLWNHNWWRAVYFFGAVIINIGILNL